MKKFLAIVFGIAVVSFAWMMLNGHQVRIQVDAQEPAKNSDAEARSKSASGDSGAFGVSGDRPYPVFFINDVVARLKTATDELIEKKLVKTSDDLREHLDRTTFSVSLPRPHAEELSPQELYRRATESVFLVAGLTRPTGEETAWQTAFSTAFAVHEDGILSTSAHVFDHDDHDDAVVALDVHGQVYPVVELLAVDRKADTCLFRIDVKRLKTLPLGQEIPPGSAIRVMGHPGDSFFFFSTGNIANYEHDEDDLVWLNITADFGQGSSGGPVMDTAGNVVGQVSRTYTLYAGGDSSSRRRRPRETRQAIGDEKDADPKKDAPKDDAADDKTDSTKSADPQMIFKACTPVTAIRALVK